MSGKMDFWGEKLQNLSKIVKNWEKLVKHSFLMIIISNQKFYKGYTVFMK